MNQKILGFISKRKDERTLKEKIKTLKSLRERHGLSQADIAKSLNVTVATINYWERGTRNPARKRVNKILKLIKLLEESK